MKRQEAWAKALAWYGKPLDISQDEADEIDRELLGAPPRPRRRRTAAR